MNNPAPQPANNPNAPDDAIILSDEDTTGSWDSSTSASDDNDEREVDSLADEGCADEAYWEEDTAADTWLARFPGGTPLLYPQLLVVKPRGGKVMTATRYPNRTDSLLRLPSEIRNRIYRHYFGGHEEVKRPEEGHALFRDRGGMEMESIRLTSTNEELKFWLSTALLQTSRQLRSEAMFILFSSRVITVEWLPAIPRFVEFLGKEGCAMVRYLDIWDTLNLSWDNKAEYRDILASVMHFSGLQHLRIVVDWGLRKSGLWSARTSSWFDDNDWKQDGTLKEDAVPKMRSEDIEKHWPEYEILKNLKTQKFTLATAPEHLWAVGYLEFDRIHGAYPEICKSMRSHAAPTQAAPPSANLATSSMSPQVLEAFEAIDIQPRSSALTPNLEFDDEDPDSHTWQETDTLANKTIPLYNFIREFFHNHLPPTLPEVEMSVRSFVAFPTAQKSTGSIMRDCVFCYLSERHCGHHAVPDQLPFEPKRHEGEGYYVEDDVKILQAQFEDLSYVDLRKVCRDIVQWMEDVDNFANTILSADVEFLKFATIFDYLGWPETPNSERLTRLDAAVEAGWTGKRVDKDEVPPWDVLYREVRSRYSNRHSFREEARNN